MTTEEKTVEALLQEGKVLIEQGQPTVAFDILNQSLLIHPNHAGLHYLAALAMVNCGSLSLGRTHLSAVLAHTPPGDPLHVDALSLDGRISKKQYAHREAGDAKRSAAVESLRCYRQAFKQSRDFFPGINAATMACLAGEVQESRLLATEVKSICATVGQPEADPWAAATMGEVHTLLGEKEQAEYWYRRAITLAGSRMGYLVSMKRQLGLLAEKLPMAADLMSLLPIPNVGVFVGHMLDHPERSTPRFPPSMVPEVAKRLEKSIHDLKIGVGYVSLACGGDILFAEAMLAQNYEVHVWLPFRQEDFLQTSVAFAGQEWVDRFHAILKNATSVSYAIQEPFLGDNLLFAYTNQLLMGACLTRAAQLGAEPFMLAVIANSSPTLAGGTMESLYHWENMGLRAERIDLRSQHSGGHSHHHTPTEEMNPWHGKRLVKTMMFADMVGFSKIAEDAAPSFMVHFLSKVADVIARSPRQPTFRNSWGDGLFLVFDSVLDAAEFALTLRYAVKKQDWQQVGLPAETSIRIGMHTGPVYPWFDPIISQDNFFGSHVNYAARIEPITAPGAVFVSEQTAFLLAASGNGRFRCDYLGEKILPKHAGVWRMYRLRWHDGEE